MNECSASLGVCSEQRGDGSTFGELGGSSAALRAVLRQITQVAGTDATVLIRGETGVGKEVVASAIQRRSRRAGRPFVRVNCAAIPAELIAAELFGHERGAFTGASQRRIGRFEAAHGGTILLDEVGELPPETQVALLRVLQEGEIERLGGERPIAVDVRVLAATNRDLEAAIAAGTFRADLYYRLEVFPIDVPPLRERGDDVVLLAERFAAEQAARAGKRFTRIAADTLDALRAYSWPGNVRELQNVIERGVILCDADELSLDLGRPSQRPRTTVPCRRSTLAATLAERERELIESALRECRGRVSGPTGAARRLGLPPSTLESKIAQRRIDKFRFRDGAAVALP